MIFVILFSYTSLFPLFLIYCISFSLFFFLFTITWVSSGFFLPAIIWVDSELGAGWIQVDSGGFWWILILPIQKVLCIVQVFAHSRGGFSATTSTLYNMKREYETLAVETLAATFPRNLAFQNFKKHWRRRLFGFLYFNRTEITFAPL